MPPSSVILGGCPKAYKKINRKRKRRVLPVIRVLVGENHRDWRKLVRLLFQIRPDWQVICEASDGSEAVQKAEELKPDIILLETDLPKLDGIEAARRIRQLSPNSKIVFLSIELSADIVQVALGTGALGYVCKADTQSDLISAVETVLRGDPFVSRSIKGWKLPHTPGANTP